MTDKTEAPDKNNVITFERRKINEWPREVYLADFGDGDGCRPHTHIQYPDDTTPKYLRADLTAAKDARIEDLEAENERLRDALERAEGLCRDRAERLNDYGLEMECCAATAKNCAEDVACTISELEESK